MVARGQIATSRYRGEHVYMLALFVIGIYEFQLPHMDPSSRQCSRRC
jgi:hypothetical protein